MCTSGKEAVEEAGVPADVEGGQREAVSRKPRLVGALHGGGRLLCKDLKIILNQVQLEIFYFTIGCCS